MLIEKIGMILKLSRVSLDMQVKEMAEKIGVTTVTVQNIEKMNNKDIPPIVKYLLVLRENGIDINRILNHINGVKSDETE